MCKIPITEYGIKKLNKELNFLKNTVRKEIINSLSEARSYGDLRENAEYHAIKEKQEFCEKRIQIIEYKLSNANIIDITKITPTNKIVFGTTINIKNLNTKKNQTYRIVGDDESDVKNNLISINSPIARGLIGKKVGETVIIKTPNGKIKYKIINVKYS